MKNILEILDNKTIPGIFSVVKTRHKTIKILWIISAFILTGWCSVFFADAVANYFKYDVVTNINIYKEIESPFPVVSFCISFDYNKNIPLLNDSMIYCYFNYEECNWYDFEMYSMLNEVCYRYNSGRNFFKRNANIKKTFRSGVKTSLEIFFKIKDYKKDFFKNLIGPFKMIVFVSNQSTIFRRDKAYNIDNGYLISNGLNYLSVYRKFIKKLDEPYNSCVKRDNREIKSHLYRYFIENNHTYKQQDCLDLCLEEIMLIQCNCSAKLGNTSICFQNKIVGNCMLEIYFKYFYTKKKLPTLCFSKCPLECDSIIYDINQNFFGVIPNQYLNLLNNSLVFEDELIYINVFYSGLEYTLLEEIPKQNLFDLVSSIGGTLGLFIGVSFISFIEIIEILIEFIFLLNK